MTYFKYIKKSTQTIAFCCIYTETGTIIKENVPASEMLFKCFAETPAIILSLLEILKKTNLTAIIILSINDQRIHDSA